MIIARIESLILERGIEDALIRAAAFVEAGADGIMIHSRKKDPAEVLMFCDRFRVKDPKIPLVVVPSSFNTITEEELAAHGVNIVIYANQLTRSAFPAMQAETFVRLLDADFFTGVPDSQLKPLCDFLYDICATDPHHHVIAANEGSAAALAAGYHLSTGKTPVVYLQNSGLGNIVNPAVSLLHQKVYAIPCLFVVGWRGEPGVHDEPQHIFQGEITLEQLALLEIPAFVLGKDTTEEQLAQRLIEYRSLFAQGRQAAVVVRKGALTYGGKTAYGNPFPMSREEAIKRRRKKV